MSTMEVTSCDGCDEMAPQGYQSILPDHGWMHVKGRADVSFEDYDVCSWQCLATLVAAKIAESEGTISGRFKNRKSAEIEPRAHTLH